MSRFRLYTAKELAEFHDDSPDVTYDGGCITIHVTGNYNYRIDLDRIDSPAKLAVWLLHLAEKTWCTPTVLQKVTQMAMSRCQFSLPWGC